jgi:hypothetical protein
MDKQKQIEEMAKLLEDNYLIMATWDSYNDDFNDNYPNECKKVATVLINAGYCKIPENAVVLYLPTKATNKEEREEKQDVEVQSARELIEDLLVEFDEYGFCPTITMPAPEGFAKRWRELMVFAVNRLQMEIEETWSLLNAVVDYLVNETAEDICQNCAYFRSLTEEELKRQYDLIDSSVEPCEYRRNGGTVACRESVIKFFKQKLLFRK